MRKRGRQFHFNELLMKEYSMKQFSGKRKFFGFLCALFFFSLVTVIALYRVPAGQVDLPSFVFQLAAAYALICGLFFGSNVMEHYAPQGREERHE
jgi:hypothetical protein